MHLVFDRPSRVGEHRAKAFDQQGVALDVAAIDGRQPASFGEFVGMSLAREVRDARDPEFQRGFGAVCTFHLKHQALRAAVEHVADTQVPTTHEGGDCGVEVGDPSAPALGGQSPVPYGIR